MSDEQSKTQALFELTPESIEIVLTASMRGKEFALIHTLRYPTQEDWIAYDKALCPFITESSDVENGLISDDSNLEAACALWDSIVKSVSGYFPGDAPEDFKKRIPPEHKRGVVYNLATVFANLNSKSEESATFFAEICDEQSVSLSALRGVKYDRLIHRFKSPSQAQRIQFSRMKSERITVRGTKNGKEKVLIPSRLSRIVSLYNDLIISVEGYSLKDQPLTETRIDDKAPQQITFFMDAMHKDAAISGLFATGEL